MFLEIIFKKKEKNNNKIKKSGSTSRKIHPNNVRRNHPNSEPHRFRRLRRARSRRHDSILLAFRRARKTLRVLRASVWRSNARCLRSTWYVFEAISFIRIFNRFLGGVNLDLPIGLSDDIYDWAKRVSKRIIDHVFLSLSGYDSPAIFGHFVFLCFAHFVPNFRLLFARI